MELIERQKQWMEDYGFIEDPMERFTILVDVGQSVTRAAEADCQEENRVEGCVSQVWVTGAKDEAGLTRFALSADADIVQGVAGLLALFYSGVPPQEVIEVEPDWLKDLQIDRHLSPTRLRGLAEVRLRLSELAAAMVEGR